MKAVYLVFLMVVVGSCAAQANPPSKVEDVVKAFKASEKSSNGVDRSALFNDDALVFNAWDDKAEGRHDVDAFWAKLFTSGTFDTSKITELDTKYTRLAKDLWLVDYIESLTGQRGPKSGRELPPRIIHMTLIVRQEKGDRWRIAYYRAADTHVRQAKAADSPASNN